MSRLTVRQQAEAIEQFGDDLLKLIKAFDKCCRSMDFDTSSRINALPHQERLDSIALGFRNLGRELSAECDQAEEAEDRRRDNPLEPDFRRLGQ